MCGIVGYIGPKKTLPLLIKGLKRLEYRGYDSAGVVLVNKNKLEYRKCQGKIKELEKSLKDDKIQGNFGIGHTRWATHGQPNEKNAHPHFSCRKKIAVVHNGIIENYSLLKELLIKEGHKFVSETDTEVIAHLIEKYYEGDFEKAVQKALVQLEGAYGLAIVCSDEPDKIIVAKNGSPLVIGIKDKEFFIASDVTPLISQTKKVIYLDDKEMAVLSRNDFKITTITNSKVIKCIKEVDWDLEQLGKANYSHYMLKEIFEQPETIKNAFRGRIQTEEGKLVLGGLFSLKDKFKDFERIIITACGTSWHAGLLGEYIIEEIAGVPVEVDYASEFRYRHPIINEKTLMIVISQSGETADTLAALKEAKKKGAKVMGIVNVVGSSIARETDAGVYIHAGPEIGVASTKAFTSQVTALYLFSLYLAQELKRKNPKQIKKYLKALEAIPKHIKKALDKSPAVKDLAGRFKKANNFLYLGRGYNFPVALEGALKLKEISYIHAEGYPAAEMKHGPIALIDENMPVVFIATGNSTIYEKVISNIEEVKAREGKVICIANEGDERIRKMADHVIYVPKAEEIVTPLLTVIPLQLLAYHLAVLRGCHVDQPRNLAKSVTVE